MILFVSGRCDIPGYYTEWFFNRLQEGFVDVRNPYDAHQISRIKLNEQNIDVIVFCTKNPLPMLNRLDEITFPYMFHVTFTPYKEEIERVEDKRRILNGIVKLADMIGGKRVVVRYDPIFLSDIYTIEYHKKAFEKLCMTLSSHVDTIIISFVDMYKNTKQNMSKMHMKDMSESDMHEIGNSFGQISSAYGIHVQTCAEEINLSMYGIVKGACFDRNQLRDIAGHALSHIKNKGVRSNCACISSVDIGDYNCCAHGCLYCYANYEASDILRRMKLHDPKSSVLIGHVEEGDRVVERKEKSYSNLELF